MNSLKIVSNTNHLLQLCFQLIFHFEFILKVFFFSLIFISIATIFTLGVRKPCLQNTYLAYSYNSYKFLKLISKI